MKKSVIVMIGVIYLMAIIVTSFFGLKISVPVEKIYATDIECSNSELYKDSSGNNRISLSGDNNSIQLTYVITPSNVDNPTVVFSVSGGAKSFGSVDENGYVSFVRRGQLKINIVVQDGSGASTIVYVDYVNS